MQTKPIQIYKDDLRIYMRYLFILIGISFGLLQQAYAANFTYIATKSVEELNQMLKVERKEFLADTSPNKAYRIPKATKAKNAVDLYRVEYESVIPEQGNRRIVAYGLVAIPKTDGPATLPFVSYQHGTVFGKKEVPSYSFLTDDPYRYHNSYETRLAVAQFGGNGYVVMAADYFGMGDSSEPEGYLVKRSHQQACLDLYLAVKDWLASERKIEQNHLFLSGWSQGGFVTMAFLEKLEEKGITVTASSTAAAPVDLYSSFNGVIYHKRPLDAVWLSTTFSLSSFAFENYYQMPGLVDRLFKPEYVPSIQKLYYRNYTNLEELQALILSLARYDEKSKGYVSDIGMLLKDEYRDPSVFGLSEFGQLAAQSEAYRWHFKTPVKMYFGTLDEAVPPRVATLAADYQKAMGNKRVVIAKPVPRANHRGAYVTAVSKQLPWFNSLRR